MLGGLGGSHGVIGVVLDSIAIRDDRIGDLVFDSDCERVGGSACSDARG